jgi:creatinine amidohydrolase/Fe(II)-dependent formamide hydrolase-like protein
MRFAVAVAAAVSAASLAAQTPKTVFLEELTWTEVRDALKAGTTTIIIPPGGTEQAAKRLGNTLVAPVVAYVPEGQIDPPTGHMRFAGTITTPADVFAKVLEYAARSFKQHGFLDIAFMGDSGGNQSTQKAVAEALNKEWASTRVRVHHLSDYYPGRGDKWLKEQGETDEVIGSHASIHDTASLLVLNPSMLRMSQAGPHKSGDGSGVTGNPARSTAAYGKKILEMQIEDAVRQIRTLRETSRK